MRRAGARGERGVALVGVLLVLLALALLAHGLLVLARLEARASRVGVEALRVRHAAEWGVRTLLTSSDGPALRAVVGVGDASPPVRGTLPAPPEAAPGVPAAAAPHPTYDARLVRLSAELWLADAVGGVHGTGVRRATSRVAWMLDPLERVSRVPAVVEVGAEAAVGGGGAIDAVSFWTTGSMCDSLGSAIDSLAADRLPPAAVAVAPAGTPTVLGRLSAAVIAALTLAEGSSEDVVRVSEPGAPAPSTSAAACRSDDPWNWGDPGSADATCAERRVVVHVPDGVPITGGTGQGLLLIPGDGALRGLDFHGVVVVSGRLVLEEGARVTGIVHAAGGLTLTDDSRVVGSACPAAAALAHPALGRLLDTDDSGWLR